MASTMPDGMTKSSVMPDCITMPDALQWQIQCLMTLQQQYTMPDDNGNYNA